MFDHKDPYGNLNEEYSLQEKIRYLHTTIRSQHPTICRIAVALYEPDTDLLTTFIYSSDAPSPLNNYQARLSDCGSLLAIIEKGQPRVVNDMELFADGEHEHTQILRATDFRASYTLPLYAEGHFLGFLFFNADQKDVFTENVLCELDMVGHLIAFMLFNAHSKIQTLLATVRSARSFSNHRDPETGQHLERMAHYSKIIARQLAKKYRFSDDTIEHIFLFAPLHDIGKLSIPDNILLKPGKLTGEEAEIMRGHATKGREMIDHLLANYGLEGIEYVHILKNITLHHHEAYDGSGYPQNLRQQDIPIEARIIAVADVFDALTSVRPYKPAWSNDEAFNELRELAGKKLDAECVEALISNRGEVERIQHLFRENAFG